MDEECYILESAGARSQDFDVCVAECVYCGGIRCAGKSLSGANVAAKHWDRSQLSILCEREPSKTKLN